MTTPTTREPDELVVTSSANRGRPGAALAAIRARLKVAKLDGTCNRALHDAKAELLETLELEDWVRLAKEDLLRRYPPTTNPL